MGGISGHLSQPGCGNAGRKDSTAKKLGEHVYRILSEVDVLNDTKSYRLRKMTLRGEVRDNLQGHSERYVLRCIEALE
jgi:Putative inner membrane protein (DUF1819)